MAVTPSALTNWVSKPGVAMDNLFADALDTSFGKVARRVWSDPVMGLTLYEQRDTTKATEKHSYVAAGGPVPKNSDEDRLPQQVPIQGFDNSYTPVEYRMQMKITRRLIETDQFNVVNKQMADLNRSAMKTLEMYAALPFNTTFDATAEWVCADGLLLVDSGRKYEDTAAGTWSNLETSGALTQARVGTMRTNFYKNKDEFGDPAPIIMQKLLIPPDLEDTVITELESAQKPGGSLNDKNFLTKYRLEYMVNPWLTSTTAWFGMGPMDNLHELYFYWGAKPRIDIQTTTESNNPDVFGKRIRMVFVSGCDRPHNIRGNQGT